MTSKSFLWLRGSVAAGAAVPFLLLLIYVFLVGVSSLEAGIRILGEDTQEALFSAATNPVAALCIGILGTALVQSSSATTSIIVGMVAAGVIGVDDAVPMVMGANIGTTVTNTVVSLGHARQSFEFRRAFEAATVHDFFNVLAALVLLPIEIMTGLISTIARTISGRLVGTAGTEWKSPVKAWVQEPVSWVNDVWDALGVNANAKGLLVVLTGLAIVLVALTLVTRYMRPVAKRAEHSVNAVLNRGGGAVALLLGLLITMIIQSSSVTTSILIPLAGAGVVALRNVYPVTLGANVGTTVTPVLASLAASSPDSLSVALAHTTFNVLGILILYILPLARDLPIHGAERLAEVAVERRILALVYVVVVFIIMPLAGVALLG